MFKKFIISLILSISSTIGFTQTIFYQDFEGGADDWNYTLNPASYSASGDIWTTRTALSSISPSSGTQFWGMQDLNNGNGGGNFDHTITFNSVNVSAHTGVTISFDYHTIGYDGPGDYIEYEIFEDGVGQGTVSLNNNTGAMTSVSYNVPNAVNSVYLVLIARQNGGSDYGGWDNVNISGVPTGGGGSFTVTFNGNGNDGGAMSNQTANSSTALTSNAFTQTGCTFIEWNTVSDGSGISYADAANYNFTADITLYAQWNCGGTPHTVTFDGNGNDGGSMSNQTASSSTFLTSNAYTQTGCTFIEWNTAANGSGITYLDAATYNFSADITLYAQWNCPPVGGGNCIDEDFVDFSDWTNSGTATDNVGSHAGLAIPCRALGSGDELTSPAVNNPTQLQFYQDASGGGSGNTALVEYSIDGGTTWVTCHTFNVTTAGGTETVNLTNVGGVNLSNHTGVLFKFSSSFSTWYLDDVVATCGSPTTNTITTGSVTGSPFSVMCASSANGTVAFTSTDPFTAGNIYTAQLSNSAGSFASPINIGTLTSTANSGTINITLPAGTIGGSGYKVRVVSSAPVVTGSESSAFTITLTDGPCATACPELTGILVDACGGAIEGINELFTFTNGSSDLYLDSLSTTFPTAGTYCNSGCGSLNWVTNPTYVTQLNTTAGCPGLFSEADPIPANSKVIVFTGALPTFNFDFSGLCGAGPYYAVFANNTSTGGRFANFSSCSVRTLRVDFGSSCSDTVAYDRCLLSNSDGDFVTYDAAGNATYQNDGCTPTSILPITLLSFDGKSIENGNKLIWQTSSEINNEFFTIERSDDAINYKTIGELNGAGNSNNLIQYNFIDYHPISGTNYYRLKQNDFDGNFSFSEVIALNNQLKNANIYSSNNILNITLTDNNAKHTLQVIDAVGRIIYTNNIIESIQLKTSSFPKGIYIVKVSNSTSSTIQKVKF